MSIPIIRKANWQDYQALAFLIEHERYIHRHLDWKPALDWLTDQPFFVLESDRQIVAALACPPDMPGIYWFRLFIGAYPSWRLSQTWNTLFNTVKESLEGSSGTFAAVGLQDWTITLLKESGFHHHQDIVVLEWEEENFVDPALPKGYSLRETQEKDLPFITDVDQAAFEPLWQNSIEGLHYAFKQSVYSTLIEKDGCIVAYQLCTGAVFNAHLARLAVNPEHQHQGLGRALIEDLQTHFSQIGIEIVTVNTQSDNTASLALYTKTGFHLTHETIPVYTLTLEKDDHSG